MHPSQAGLPVIFEWSLSGVHLAPPRGQGERVNGGQVRENWSDTVSVAAANPNGAYWEATSQIIMDV